MPVWQFPTTLWLRVGGLTVYIVFLFFRDLKLRFTSTAFTESPLMVRLGDMDCYTSFILFSFPPLNWMIILCRVVPWRRTSTLGAAA